MAIPTKIAADLTLFIASVKAAAPLTSATQITLAALQTAGQAIIAELDAALAAAGSPLDAADPAGFPGAFAVDLLALATASEDQAALSDIRGLVGRALFNIAQTAAA